MSEEMRMEQAKKVYEQLIQYFDARNYNYEKAEDQLAIVTGVQGEDIPIRLIYRVIPRLGAIHVYSPFRTQVSQDRSLDVAVALNVINARISFGAFALNSEDGTVFYRMSQKYDENLISKEVFDYLLDGAVMMIDSYNQDIEAFITGATDLEFFLNKVNR